MFQEKELNDSSIQEWCEKLDKCPRREMTKEETAMFLTCCFHEKDMPKHPELKKYLEESGMESLIYKRVKKIHTYSMEISVVIFLASICESPGMAVEYINFLQYQCKKLDIKHINMEIFASKIFPDGIFRKQDLMEMWDEQKVLFKDHGLLNLLDFPSCMKSIEIK